ncbi:MAG: DoxX family protein [Myxococcales bacterium]|nr:DoxX family protein [Myxococcales bacterium]
MTTQTVLSRIPDLARALLGLGFLVFGLNGFLNFMPTPDVPASAGAFLGALAATGYMFPVIKGVEVIVGALLLSNRFVPLALTLVAPIMVNIVLFHAVLAPAGLGMVLTLLALQLYLAWSYRDSFRAVLTAHARPAAGDDPRAQFVHASARA